MIFIELFDFIIYQHLNKRTQILPLAISQISIYATSLITFALPISKPRFKGIIFFYQNSSNMKLFLQKNAKFSSAGGSAPRSPCIPTAVGFAPKPPASGIAGLTVSRRVGRNSQWWSCFGGLAPPPDPQNNATIVNFWLRACSQSSLHWRSTFRKKLMLECKGCFN